MLKSCSDSLVGRAVLWCCATSPASQCHLYSITWGTCLWSCPARSCQLPSEQESGAVPAVWWGIRCLQRVPQYLQVAGAVAVPSLLLPCCCHAWGSTQLARCEGLQEQVGQCPPAERTGPQKKECGVRDVHCEAQQWVGCWCCGRGLCGSLWCVRENISETVSSSPRRREGKMSQQTWWTSEETSLKRAVKRPVLWHWHPVWSPPMKSDLWHHLGKTLEYLCRRTRVYHSFILGFPQRVTGCINSDMIPVWPGL